MSAPVIRPMTRATIALQTFITDDGRISISGQELLDILIKKERLQDRVTKQANHVIVVRYNKDNLGEDELFEEFFRCRACHNHSITKNDRFCGYCGRKIKWEDKPKETT